MLTCGIHLHVVDIRNYKAFSHKPCVAARVVLAPRKLRVDAALQLTAGAVPMRNTSGNIPVRRLISSLTAKAGMLPPQKPQCVYPRADTTAVAVVDVWLRKRSC